MVTTLDELQIEDATQAIRQVTSRYKRRYYWTDEEELTQEAWVAVMKALPNWDERFGVDSMARYFYKAAEYALRPFVWKQLSILSAPSQELTELFQHQLRNNREVEHTSESAQEMHPLPVDEVVGERLWQDEVAERLFDVFDRLDNGDLAMACLLKERKPSRVARAAGVPVDLVYRATERARREISRDYLLYKLWRGKCREYGC